MERRQIPSSVRFIIRANLLYINFNGKFFVCLVQAESGLWFVY
jgi:hypothetical protein